MNIYISLMRGASWGGSEDCWFENLGKHAHQGQTSDFLAICTTFNKSIKEDLSRRGIRYEIAPWSQHQSKTLLSRLYQRIFPSSHIERSLNKKTKTLLGERNSILVNQGKSYCISNHPYLIDALVSGNHKFEIVCHSPIMELPSEDQIRWMNIALHNCIRVHVLSHSAASDLNAFFTVDSNKIVFFKNPIQLEAVKFPQEIKGKIKLGFVGRISSQKGIDYVLRLMLDKDVSNHISCIHFFGEGSIPKDIEERIKRNGIDVFKHGSIEDKNEIYSTFDMLLLPSRLEALPNVLIEAGVYGKFPLVPRIGSIASVMPRNWDHYVNPLDFQAFREQVLSIFSLPSFKLHDATQAFQKSVLRYQNEHHLLSF